MKARIEEVVDSAGARLAGQDILVHRITGHSGSGVTSDISPEHRMVPVRLRPPGPPRMSAAPAGV